MAIDIILITGAIIYAIYHYVFDDIRRAKQHDYEYNKMLMHRVFVSQNVLEMNDFYKLRKYVERNFLSVIELMKDDVEYIYEDELETLISDPFKCEKYVDLYGRGPNGCDSMFKYEIMCLFASRYGCIVDKDPCFCCTYESMFRRIRLLMRIEKNLNDAGLNVVTLSMCTPRQERYRFPITRNSGLDNPSWLIGTYMRYEWRDGSDMQRCLMLWDENYNIDFTLLKPFKYV